mmetsp:Transcript_31962/g.60120  ORF Transcript_31962/g.60120 Transcript_31962/m.60120 type:complete len:124 (-) Transcript_31962:414-785(-)
MRNGTVICICRFFNTDTSGCISIEEYRRSYASIKRRSAKPSSATNYSSMNQMQLDRHRHRRVEPSPQDMYQKPVTTSQEIGWTAMAPKSTDPLCKDTGKLDHNPLQSTDVTRGEGRSVADYFL